MRHVACGINVIRLANALFSLSLVGICYVIICIPSSPYPFHHPLSSLWHHHRLVVFSFQLFQRPCRAPTTMGNRSTTIAELIELCLHYGTRQHWGCNPTPLQLLLPPLLPLLSVPLVLFWAAAVACAAIAATQRQCQKPRKPLDLNLNFENNKKPKNFVLPQKFTC